MKQLIILKASRLYHLRTWWLRKVMTIFRTPTRQMAKSMWKWPPVLTLWTTNTRQKPRPPTEISICKITWSNRKSLRRTWWISRFNQREVKKMRWIRLKYCKTKNFLKKLIFIKIERMPWRTNITIHILTTACPYIMRSHKNQTNQRKKKRL